MSGQPFHPDKNLPGCMMSDGGEACAGYTALADDWHKLSGSHAELVRALELARARIEYLGAACSNPKHFEANANHFLPAIDAALATLTARKVG